MDRADAHAAEPVGEAGSLGPESCSTSSGDRLEKVYGDDSLGVLGQHPRCDRNVDAVGLALRQVDPPGQLRNLLAQGLRREFVGVGQVCEYGGARGVESRGPTRCPRSPDSSLEMCRIRISCPSARPQSVLQ